MYSFMKYFMLRNYIFHKHSSAKLLFLSVIFHRDFRSKLYVTIKTDPRNITS
jgi:hypothetical protein